MNMASFSLTLSKGDSNVIASSGLIPRSLPASRSGQLRSPLKASNRFQVATGQVWPVCQHYTIREQVSDSCALVRPITSGSPPLRPRRGVHLVLIFSAMDGSAMDDLECIWNLPSEA